MLDKLLIILGSILVGSCSGSIAHEYGSTVPFNVFFFVSAFVGLLVAAKGGKAKP
jgi:hypothetical protein